MFLFFRIMIIIVKCFELKERALYKSLYYYYYYLFEIMSVKCFADWRVQLAKLKFCWSCHSKISMWMHLQDVLKTFCGYYFLFFWSSVAQSAFRLAWFHVFCYSVKWQSIIHLQFETKHVKRGMECFLLVWKSGHGRNANFEPCCTSSIMWWKLSLNKNGRMAATESFPCLNFWPEVGFDF